MKIFFQLFLAVFFLASCSNSAKLGKVLKSKDKEYKLKMAEQYYAQKRYYQAQTVYEDILPLFKGDTRYEDMFYKYTYSIYDQGFYLNASDLFKTYTENFPNSNRLEEMEYMRAYAFYKLSPKVELDQTDTYKAMSLMQAFINTHPQSPRSKDAASIIELCHEKLELKDYKSAILYYNLGYFKAAAISFTTLLSNYPDSKIGDQYEIEVIKSYFQYALNSYQNKQVERFEKVISEASEFKDRFPESKLITVADDYKAQSQNKINKLQNEQTKTAVQQ
ncbi:MAG: outer membrane protein assembly factor BamD [Bacteroidetes bacterium]|nr:outer membrane protein assembly factor BamD [Bacteroidota bacterium]